MSTLIIGSLIIWAVFMSLRYYIKQRGSCGDCGCSCPVKDEMQKAARQRLKETR
ncbi:FeoB-associated Cys-rich membrane protein [Streptococcus chenjunshii]|uniref:FeoB-associated Cys-rich membrane protein n=1 Tax=Streptococcus chenjunshii TaxID=2173853 RepID=A0A372KKL7_9STRE|nr:FeoB-associated Cys-rich membrane protein [Streptococcus chenjunshii]AXQ78226.1 FeoB-associated Cys-rich membrane protein [Streptococcus chenjunshii]RFU50242.1 FeoB-associated Cys-rich membrane protein [Streptococcus chenjunshii]RFU52454.1 FeoB-associated Cys-rich membrane protein [Streptococcus chenjunshii]